METLVISILAVIISHERSKNQSEQKSAGSGSSRHETRDWLGKRPQKVSQTRWYEKLRYFAKSNGATPYNPEITDDRRHRPSLGYRKNRKQDSSKQVAGALQRPTAYRLQGMINDGDDNNADEGSG